MRRPGTASSPRPRRPRPAARFKLALAYGALFLASGAVLLGVTYVLVEQATGSGAVFVTTGRSAGTTVVGRIGGTPVVQSSGGARSGSAGVVGVPATGQSPAVWRTASGTVVAQVPVPGVPPGRRATPQQAVQQLRLLQSQAANEHALVMHTFLWRSGLALLLTAVLALFLGWIVAGRVLRPLQLITTKARAISSTNLHERVRLAGPEDELREVGDTFDELLDRLEQSFDAQRRFVAHASHELRSPLARQRTILEVASSDPEATVDSLREAAAAAVVAGEEQEGLIEALLTLAASERGLEHNDLVDLGALAADAVRTRADDLGRFGIRIDLQPSPASVMGSSRLLQRLLDNLVDNGVRHNRPGGRLSVTTGVGDAGASLQVTSSGPVVAAEDVDRLFRPFERLDPGRTQGEQGHGLGLSIVAAVASAHRADLVASPLPDGGLDVRVTFPPIVPAASPLPGPRWGQGVLLHSEHAALDWTLRFTRTVVDLDGRRHELPWGEHFLPLAPGAHRLTVSYRGGRWSRAGAASVTLELAADQVAPVAYRPPRSVLLAFRPGRLTVGPPGPPAE